MALKTAPQPDTTVQVALTARSETRSLSAGLAEAGKELGLLTTPGIDWHPYGDDKCDCLMPLVFQQTNPSTGWTNMVRLCCLAEALAKLSPEAAQLMTTFPAWYEVNRNRYVTTPLPWDNREMDMPHHLWMRRMAQETGRPLAEIRAEYRDRWAERPRKLAPDGDTGYERPTDAELAFHERERLTMAGWYVDGDEGAR